MKPFDRIFSWYASRAAMPYWSVLFLDCFFVLLSGYVSYAICNGTLDTLVNALPVGLTFLFFLIPYLIGFRLFHTYSGILRYSSFIDLQKVALSALVGMALALLLQMVPGFDSFLHLSYLSPSVVVLQGLLTIILMWTARIWGKMLYESYTHRSRSMGAFVYGTRAGGLAIAKNFNTQANSKYHIVGFVSDDEDMLDKRLLGCRIFPNDDTLVKNMDELKASVLIVSPLMTAHIRQDSAIVDKLADAGKKIFIFPEEQEWDGKSELNMNSIREVNAEDLLPRDKIEVDMEAIGNQLRGKRILITGAAGSIGSEMVRQVAPYAPAELILIDQAETPLHDIRLMMAHDWPELKAHTIVADISNKDRMADIFRRYRPEYVFHAAAYKHVPMMEDNPNESIVNNVKGTQIVADLSVETGVKKFVMVSTDKAVNPTNVMGCSKRICEIYVQALDTAIKEGKVKGKTQFVTTRFGNVLGSNGSVIPLFKKQIREGGPVTVTHPDIIRYFMLIPEACKLVLEAGTMGAGGEIFVFDMGEPVKIVDLARRMIRLSGAKNVEVKFTGLRDGEKLYEEVLNDRELTKPTFHPKIMIATVREYDFSDVSATINEMVEAALSEEPMDVVRRMKQLVPEFKSQHSVYQALDK